MSNHFHYEYAEARHDHRGEYTGERHDHDLDYAEKHHRHYDLEREDERLKGLLDRWQADLSELREQLEGALARIQALEAQTPEARQLQLEADLAAADLAESGYRLDDYGPPAGAGRHGSRCQCPYCYVEPEAAPPVTEYDPGPEVDDEGGMSEYRYVPPEDYERGQS